MKDALPRTSGIKILNPEIQVMPNKIINMLHSIRYEILYICHYAASSEYFNYLLDNYV